MIRRRPQPFSGGEAGAGGPCGGANKPARSQQPVVVHPCSSSVEEETSDCEKYHSDDGSCNSCDLAEPPSLSGPRAPVLRALCASEAGARLPAAVAAAARALEGACAAPDMRAAHGQLAGALQELHGAIVTTDHGLAEPTRARGPAVAAAEAALLGEARQWLKDAQAYVLHVQAQASALAAPSSGAGAGDAWAFLVLDAARCLGRAGRQMAAGGGGGVSYGDVPLRAGAGGRRLISGACLPYAAHWAKAVAI